MDQGGTMKQILKKIIFIMSAVLICTAVLGVTLSNREREFDSMREYMESKYSKIKVSASGDYVQYNYQELMDSALIVAVVTPKDELTVDNSHGVTDSGDIFYVAHSLREVRVVESIKGDMNVGTTIKIAEKCVLLEDGTLVMFEDCYPMQKDDYYLIFLTTSSYPGNPLLAISADNGKYDLSNLYLTSNRRTRLLAEACVDLWPEIQEGNENKEGLFSAESGLSVYDQKDTDKWKPMYFTSPYTESGKELVIEVLERESQTFYRIDEDYYVYDADGN